MADEVTRSAAKLATLVAIPLALVAGVIAFVVLADVLGGAPQEQAPTTPVTTEARDLPERQETVCRALLSQLPQTVGDLPQRPVTAGPEQNAAYGEPPIMVECGVPPAQVAPTDRVWLFEGVCYQEVDETTWVTADREVPVRVTVPDDYGGQWVGEFSPTIIATVLSADADEIPSGCRE